MGAVDELQQKTLFYAYFLTSQWLFLKGAPIEMFHYYYWYFFIMHLLSASMS